MAALDVDPAQSTTTTAISSSSSPRSARQPQTFHIGTRRSLLARIQTDEVVRLLQRAWPHYRFEVHAMATTGDNNQSTALYQFTEKSLWTQELEVLLQRGELDLIVHSLKDMPTRLPEDLELGCVPVREDARDALVVAPRLAGSCRGGLGELPEGSVVGTSSLRRTAQMRRRYGSHLNFADVRGNIGTRLAKLDADGSEFAGMILAAAGLKRLGMGERITAYLSSREEEGGMLHAVGQGALGVEVRKGDEQVRELLAPIRDERASWAVLAERAVMRTLEGGCSVPIGVETEWVRRKEGVGGGLGVGVKPKAEYDTVTGLAETEDEPQGDVTDELIMRAVVVSLDGTEAAEAEARRRVTGALEADHFGQAVADMLVQRGADKILAAMKGIRAGEGK